MATTNGQKKYAPRKESEYFKMNRSLAASHLRTEKAKDTDVRPGFRLSDFFSRRVFSWLYYYLQNRFGQKHHYDGYSASDTGVYEMPADVSAEPVVLGVVGDWGTYTSESIAIARKMGNHHPHYTVHIGDTYFVGAPHEIANNFTNAGAPWVRGRLGSFALMGNHEMYARGIAYFDTLLPTLGLRDGEGKNRGQKAAYFCLQNKYWRILGLDTGYHSIGKIPIIEMLRWFAPRCRFPKKMMRWLNGTVKPDNPSDKRALLVLSHHQYISAYKEMEYFVPAKQLASCIGTKRPILWLWGHEHKFSVYEKMQMKGGPTAYGRCIGHGGMPVELGSFKKAPGNSGYDKLVMVDDRPMPGTEAYPLGYNGYAMIRVAGPRLTIEYHDKNCLLFTEEWTADGKGGMTGAITTPPHPQLRPVAGKTWGDAVK
jgi:hypothetical protein